MDLSDRKQQKVKKMKYELFEGTRLIYFIIKIDHIAQLVFGLLPVLRRSRTRQSADDLNLLLSDTPAKLTQDIGRRFIEDLTLCLSFNKIEDIKLSS